MPKQTSVELDDDLAAARILARTHERNRADFPVGDAAEGDRIRK